MKKRILFLFALTASVTASAVVTRHDVDDAKYRVAPAEFAALADMPNEGHGVLIAAQWVITAAHTISHRQAEVAIAGLARKIERIIIHPGYKTLPSALIAQAMQSGDATKAMEFQAANDDIALIKLAAPVTDVEPALIYQAKDELGMRIKIIGKGATGNGIDGQVPHGGNRTSLRRAFNTITHADNRWLAYVFNAPATALPLEGMSGNGDSGGPVLIEKNGRWMVAGLAAWKYVQGDPKQFRPATYGQIGYNVRLSHYVDWIESVMPAGS